MALKFAPVIVVRPPEIHEDVRTKYGQIACRICRREPPIGYTGICYTCTHAGKVESRHTLPVKTLLQSIAGE